MSITALTPSYHSSLSSTLSKQNVDETLISSCLKGDIQEIQRALNQGANPNQTIDFSIQERVDIYSQVDNEKLKSRIVMLALNKANALLNPFFETRGKDCAKDYAHDMVDLQFNYQEVRKSIDHNQHISSEALKHLLESLYYIYSHRGNAVIQEDFSNTQKISLLELALIFKSSDIATLLVEHGARLEPHRNYFFPLPQEDVLSTIQVTDGYVELLKELVNKYGLTVEQLSGNFTPQQNLHFLLCNQQIKAAQFLIDQHVALYTPQECAQYQLNHPLSALSAQLFKSSDCLEGIRLILDQGADPYMFATNFKLHINDVQIDIPCYRCLEIILTMRQAVSLEVIYSNLAFIEIFFEHGVTFDEVFGSDQGKLVLSILGDAAFNQKNMQIAHFLIKNGFNEKAFKALQAQRNQQAHYNEISDAILTN